MFRYCTLFLCVTLPGLSSLHADELTASERSTPEQAQTARLIGRFLETLRRQPQQGTALDRVYSHYVAEGTLDELLRSLIHQAESAEHSVEEQAAAWCLTGLIEQKRGRHPAAVAAFRRSLHLVADDPRRHWALARSLGSLGQYHEAADVLSAALEQSPSDTSSLRGEKPRTLLSRSEQLSIYRELGQACRRSQQYERAGRIWKEMERRFPDDLRVSEEIAGTLREEGDTAEALRRFTDLATRHRDPYQAVQASLVAARLKFELGQQSEALQDFETALQKVDRDSWMARHIRSEIDNILNQADDPTAAADYYEKRVAEHPDDLQTLVRLAGILAQQGRFDDARRYYEIGVERAPSSLIVRRALIDHLLRESKTAEAVAQYEQLQKLRPGDADTIERWGSLYLRMTELPEAERRRRAAAVWKMLVQERPDDPATVRRSAELMRRAELHEEAIEYYRRAIALAPEDPLHREAFGEFLHSTGRTDEALEIWNSITAGRHRTRENLIQVSEIFQRFGFQEQAIEAMQAAVRMHPEFDLLLKTARLKRQYKNNGRYPLAFEALEHLRVAGTLAGSPDDHLMVLRERVQCFAAADQLSQETERLRRVTGIDAPDRRDGQADAAAWSELAACLESLNQLEDAAVAIEQALTLEAENLVCLTQAAVIYEAAGRLTDAAAVRRRLIHADARRRSEHLRQLATIEEQLGRREEAIQAADELVAVAPDKTDSLRFHWELCNRLDAVPEGLRQLRMSARSAQADEQMLILLAESLASRNEVSESIEICWQAMDRTNSRESRRRIVLLLSDLHLRILEFGRLIDRLESMGRSQSDPRDSAFLIALALKTSGDNSAARSKLESVLSEDSQDVDLLTELSQLAQADGDLLTAADYQRRVNAVAPESAGLNRLAVLMEMIGERDEAQSLWVQSARGQTTHGDKLAVIDRLILTEAYHAARQLTVEMNRQRPHNWEVSVRGGIIDWRERRFDDAMIWFNRLLESDHPFSSETTGGSPRTGTAAFSGTSAASPLRDRILRVPETCELLADSETIIDADNSTSRSIASRIVDYDDARALAVAAQLLDADRRGVVYDFPEQQQDSLRKDRQSIIDALVGLSVLNSRAADTDCSDLLLSAMEFAVADEDPELMDVCLHLLKSARRNTGPQDRLLHSVRTERSLLSGETSPEFAPLSVDAATLYLRCCEALLRHHPEWQQEGLAETLIRSFETADTKSLLTTWTQQMLNSENSATVLFAAELWIRQQPGNRRVSEILSSLEQPVQRALTRLQEAGSGRTQRTAFSDRMIRSLIDHTEHEQPAVRGDSLLQVLSAWLQWNAHSGLCDRSPRGQPPFSGTHLSAGTSGTLFLWSMFSESEWSLLHAICEQFASVEGTASLSSWCDQQHFSTPESESLMLIIRSAICLLLEQHEESLLWLARASSRCPEHLTLLRILIHELRSGGYVEEAMLLMEQNPDTLPGSLKERCFEMLELAAEAGDEQRAGTAAARLSGIRLSPAEQSRLVSQLRRLGMTDRVRELNARRPSAGSAEKATSSFVLMERYLEAGNDIAASQIAQQLIVRPDESAAPWRNSIATTPQQQRARAGEVLKKSGRLEQILAQHENQLQKSPNSIHLLKGYRELLKVADREQEAAAVERRLREMEQKPVVPAVTESVDTLMRMNRNEEACDALVELLKQQPRVFWNNQRYPDAFIDADRVSVLLDALESVMFDTVSGSPLSPDTLNSERLNSQVLTKLPRRGVPTATIDSVFGLLTRLLDDATHHDDAVRLIRMLSQFDAAHLWRCVDAVTNARLWSDGTMFELLVSVYVPMTDNDGNLRAGLTWTTSDPRTRRVFPASGDSERSHSSLPPGSLMSLFDAIRKGRCSAEHFQNHVTQAQSQLPDWPAAPVLLIVAEAASKADEITIAGHVSSLTEGAASVLPANIVHELVEILSRNDTGLNRDAIELLRHIVQSEERGDNGLLSFHQIMLLRLYIRTRDREPGLKILEEFVLGNSGFIRDQDAPDESLPDEPVTGMVGTPGFAKGISGIPGNSEPSMLTPRHQTEALRINHRLAAGKYALALGSPLLCLSALDGISAADEDWSYSVLSEFPVGDISQEIEYGELSSLRSQAMQQLSVTDLIGGIQSSLRRDELARVSLCPDLTLTNGEESLPRLGCSVLEELTKRMKSYQLAGKTSRDRVSQEVQKLQKILQSEMNIQHETAVDDFLIVLGVCSVLESGDQSAIEVLVPSFTDWLAGRPAPGTRQDSMRRMSRSEVESVCRRLWTQAGFAWIAAYCSEDSLPDYVRELMFDHAIRSVRELEQIVKTNAVSPGFLANSDQDNSPSLVLAAICSEQAAFFQRTGRHEEAHQAWLTMLDCLAGPLVTESSDSSRSSTAGRDLSAEIAAELRLLLPIPNGR